MTYLQLFLQSAGIELVCVTAFFFRDVPLLRLLAVSLAVNAFTHPLVVFGALAVPGANLLTCLVAAEAATIAIEAETYRRALGCGGGKAWLCSGSANLLSWQLGPLLSYMLAKPH